MNSNFVQSKGKLYQTFLSYNNDDKSAVEELANRLRLEGIEPWLDSWNLIPGKPWQEEIEQALENCLTCCVFIGPKGIGPWQISEMRVAIDRLISKGNFRVIPVLLPGTRREQRSSYPSFLTQNTWVEFRDNLDDPSVFHRLISGIYGISPGPDSQSLPEQATCPYRGLEVFDEEHAAFFFGREAITEWLVEAIRPQANQLFQTNRFLAIIGASGSGKSSLARAGMLPALRRGILPDSNNWPVLVLKPGFDPLESLAITLKKDSGLGATINDVGDLKKRLLTDSDRLHLTIRLALEGKPEFRRVVILVDQFEEIFTVCREERLRQKFIDELIYASTNITGQTIVVIAMRADFYGKCATYGNLAAAMSDHHFLVGPMTDQEIRDTIVRPSQLAGCEFEPGLVDLLINDFKGEPGKLPILEYALTQLWQNRKGRRLTLETYNIIGMLEGALEKRANKIFDELSPDKQKICKQIFLRLIQPGEGTEDTKRRAYRSDIASKDQVDDVLRILAAERLITTEALLNESESFVEISHEALIRGWPKLKLWIEENRNALRTQTRLAIAAREWDREGRQSPDEYLYRGARLSEAEELRNNSDMQLSILEQEFLDFSIKYRETNIREKRKRQFIVLITIVFCALFLGGGIVLAFKKFQEAESTRIQLAKIQEAINIEMTRTDILGALTVFGAGYGQQGLEEHGRGLFTKLLEKQIFTINMGLSKSVVMVQNELRSRKQQAELVSSLNGEIYLNPRNEKRKFFALICGWDYFNKPGSRLKGAVADAESIHKMLKELGYDATVLLNSSRDEFEQAIINILEQARKDCIELSFPVTVDGRGVVELSDVSDVSTAKDVSEVKPCQNVVLFLYLSGHGCAKDGVSYIIPADAKGFDDKAIGIEELRGRIAKSAAIQIIIADTSRGIEERKANESK